MCADSFTRIVGAGSHVATKNRKTAVVVRLSERCAGISRVRNLYWERYFGGDCNCCDHGADSEAVRSDEYGI
ncbi:unnamed protein product [Heligmosomoides polygyrus]|uniref:Transposase n=1 Tax=Heligmosomoides polygyrus TaxID=6339 RepID=A0A183F1U5_HELPZ|nr:unnamed protein product [Heligmosomoides polygyrus]